MNWQSLVADLVAYGILTFSFLLASFYLSIGLLSVIEIKDYLRKNYFTDFRVLATSNYLPGISILAPAYNEGANIVENVRSMLSIHYNKLELIIINDGSKDDSMSRLKEAYDLYQVDILINEHIPTKKIRGIYKSRNPVFHRLIVVDKDNGGKSDALNVGVNTAKYDYLVCIDVDCVLEQDALLKMVKPFLESNKTRVIASGGVIRIANDCAIQNGKLIKVNLPRQFLPRVQIIEYIRAFLLGRMAWSRLNGLLLISGAFGAFDKEIVIKCGGYDTKTVGEDMELIVRMRRYMEENNLPYRVTFIPDPLCWTEAPSDYKILGRQRNRWTRGTIETLCRHKIMFFNAKYGRLGLLSYPYWFFFEFLAPIVEFVGMCIFIIFCFMGIVNWQTFFILLGAILLLGFLYSVFAIFMEVLTYNQYKNKHDKLKLVITAFLEPLLFHPFIVWSAIRGNIDYLRKKHSWGEMTRQGLGSSSQPVKSADTVHIEYEKDSKPAWHSNLWKGLQEAVAFSFLLFACTLLLNTFELLRNFKKFGLPDNLTNVIGHGMINELSFLLNWMIVPVIIFTSLYLLSKKFARGFILSLFAIFLLLHASLAEYFLNTLVPLGADLFGYSLADILQTAGAATISYEFVIGLLFIVAIAVYLFKTIPQKLKISRAISIICIGLYTIGLTGSVASVANNWQTSEEFTTNIVINKSWYFLNSCYKARYGQNEKLAPAKDEISAIDYVDEKKYPFLHRRDTTDVLSNFFQPSSSPPNFVFVVVEGLGRAFSNKGAYLGSFTPFIDSLSEQSLYWDNFLSTGGRTFAMLPSVFGSLPFGENGFLELGNQMPRHSTLLSILKNNGYQNNFFYGGNASFDKMDQFLHVNHTNIYDEKTFSTIYQKMPAGSNGFTWGYADKEVYQKFAETNALNNRPTCNIILTLSTHNPFLINEQSEFLEKFEARMRILKFSEAQKREHRRYTDQYASILYADNAVQELLTRCKSMPGFNNTVFIVTGDHRMPEIPMSTKIDRYHVPLIIYSPLLKRPQQFKAVGTHLDITPSLLSFLKNQYQLKVPTVGNWLGKGLDTARYFRSKNAYPFMQTKNAIEDFVMDSYLLHNDELYKISENMNIEPVGDEGQLRKMKTAFGIFKSKNNRMSASSSMLPDSLHF